MAFVLPTFQCSFEKLHYCKEDDEEFLNHIPNFAQIKRMLYIHSKLKTFLDKLEVDGATSYLILLLYLICHSHATTPSDDVIKSSQPSAHSRNRNEFLLTQNITTTHSRPVVLNLF